MAGKTNPRTTVAGTTRGEIGWGSPGPAGPRLRTLALVASLTIGSALLPGMPGTEEDLDVEISLKAPVPESVLPRA